MENSNLDFVFGSFMKDSDMDTISMTPVIPIKQIKPEIEGSTFKIGEIDCFLPGFNKSASESEDEQKEPVLNNLDLHLPNLVTDIISMNLALISSCLDSTSHKSASTTSVEAFKPRIMTPAAAVESFFTFFDLHGFDIAVFDPSGAVPTSTVRKLHGFRFAIVVIISSFLEEAITDSDIDPLDLSHDFIGIQMWSSFVFDPGGSSFACKLRFQLLQNSNLETRKGKTRLISMAFCLTVASMPEPPWDLLHHGHQPYDPGGEGHSFDFQKLRLHTLPFR